MSFTNTDIEGLDLAAGITRFGGNEKLYAKIIKTFIDNIGPHLDKLAGLTLEGLEDYAIEVHGVKGSLYGISANKEGDAAKELEISAKAGDFATVSAGNVPFIDSVKELNIKLKTLLDDYESGAEAGQKKAEPDRALLQTMLEASREFDVDKVQDALKELEKYEYEKDGDLVKWLSEEVTAFGFDKIEERLTEIL